MLQKVQGVETPSIKFLLRRHVLPGDDDEQVEIQPPNYKQQEIKRAHAHDGFVPFQVRPYRESAHERDKMQKQSNVPDKRIGDLGAQDDFNVSPEELHAQPHAAAQGEESPEKPGGWFRRPDVAQDGEYDKGKEETLGKIANRGQLVAAWNDKGNDGLESDESRRENPTLLPRGDSRAHTLILGADSITGTLRKSSEE